MHRARILSSSLFLLLLLVGFAWWIQEPSRSTSAIGQVAARDFVEPPQVVLPQPPEEVPVPWRGGIQVESPVTEAVARPPISEPEGPLLDDLVAELRELWQEEPDRFHTDAPDLLQAFVASMSLSATELVESVEAHRVRRDLSEPVRGALEALRASAWPESLSVASCLSEVGASREERRGVRLGLAADWSGLPGVRGLRIDFAGEAYMSTAYRDDVRPLLGLSLVRIPAPGLRELLLADLYRTAENLDEVVDRWLSVFALGVAVELDPQVFDVFVELLFDDSPLGQQVHMPILFVLSQSDREPLLDLIRQYLVAGPEGAVAKDLARLWLAGQSSLDDVLTPLFDGLPAGEVTFALGALNEWLATAKKTGQGLDASEEERAVEAVVRSVADHEDASLRLVATTLLAFSTSHGMTRLHALEDVLENDDVPFHRLMAARGLGRSAVELRGEALALLRARVSQEVDPSVLAVLEQVLAEEN